MSYSEPLKPQVKSFFLMRSKASSPTETLHIFIMHLFEFCFFVLPYLHNQNGKNIYTVNEQTPLFDPIRNIRSPNKWCASKYTWVLQLNCVVPKNHIKCQTPTTAVGGKPKHTMCDGRTVDNKSGIFAFVI